MRLWSLHPRYLDARGLVALWREGLLARAVLRGKTRGYRHHPQLQRFRAHPAPRAAVSAYLRGVVAEADARGYAFQRSRAGRARTALRLTVTRGQLEHEWRHLMRKLKARSPGVHARWRTLPAPRAHPLFRVVPGEIASWERLSRRAPRAHDPKVRAHRVRRRS